MSCTSLSRASSQAANYLWIRQDEEPFIGTLDYIFVYDPNGVPTWCKGKTDRKCLGRFSEGEKSMGLGSDLGKDLQSMKRIVAGFNRVMAFSISQDDQQNLSSRCVGHNGRNMLCHCHCCHFLSQHISYWGWWFIFHQSKNVVSSIIPTYPNYTGMMMPICTQRV